MFIYRSRPLKYFRRVISNLFVINTASPVGNRHVNSQTNLIAAKCKNSEIVPDVVFLSRICEQVRVCIEKKIRAYIIGCLLTFLMTRFLLYHR